MVNTPLPHPEEGRADNLLFRFVFGTQNINKRVVPSVSGSLEEESGGPCITEVLPSSSLTSRQQWVAQENPSCLFVETGKDYNTRVPASSRHTPVCHKPQAGFLRCCISTWGGIRCVTLHTQTLPPDVTGKAITGPGPGPCVPSHCPTVGTLVFPLVPLAQSLGAWLALPSLSRWLLRTIRLGYAIQFARHPQVQGHPVLFSQGRRCSCLVCRDCSPAGEGCDRAGPSGRSGFYSPYFILPKKSSGLPPILDLWVLNCTLH